ncbi:hemin uptake protein HemP [Chelativorans sp. EGI FJ00035]|uniref:Hemin uptake protein HemP n=1 Tax=Chelativorans salis TaxID=2978478 RepID=A0ABT2LLN8_9HYPH|nr:hemin uptake protein HemP [Chelativorans sp. EGI FJ00035]
MPVRQGVDFRNSGAIPDRTVTSDDLFCGRREIAIEHAGSFYRLKITRQGKLILNK